MRIDVTGKHVDLTPAIVRYAEEKCERLSKFFDGLQQVRCVLDKEHNGFRVEVIADVVGRDDFVVHVDGADVYACIDQAVDKCSRLLKDHKEKLRDHR
ncbi:MAG: ribosome-associated translation inhibitor RaiA [Phycisphaerales bacterium]